MEEDWAFETTTSMFGATLTDGFSSLVHYS